MQRRLDRSIDRAIRLTSVVSHSQSVESGYAHAGLLHARDVNSRRLSLYFAAVDFGFLHLS